MKSNNIPGYSSWRRKALGPLRQRPVTIRIATTNVIVFLIFITLIFLIFTGCDDRFDFLANVNAPPALAIQKYNVPTSDPTQLTDGVKISLKHNNLPYTILLKASDRETKISAINYRFLMGSGSLVQAGQPLSGAIELTAGEALVTFEPVDVGRVLIEFSVGDAFERKALAKMDLNVFLNMPPVSKFKYEFAGTHGPYEYRLDASESFDQDQAQGGSIKAYRFIINDSYEIVTTQPIVTHSFEGPGPERRDVKLEVIDNDGEKSELFSLIVR